VALHLGYAFLSDLHEYHLRKLESLADGAANAAQNPPESSDTSNLNYWVSHLRLLIENRRRDLEKRTFWMQASSIGVATFSLTVLIVSGISPNLPISACALLLLLSVTTLPMPLFCFWSYVSHCHWRKRIKATEGNLRREWTNVISPILAQWPEIYEKVKKWAG
jgi:hypothetical protein